MNEEKNMQISKCCTKSFEIVADSGRFLDGRLNEPNRPKTVDKQN